MGPCERSLVTAGDTCKGDGGGGSPTSQLLRSVLELLLLLVAQSAPLLAYELGDLRHPRLGALSLQLRLADGTLLLAEQKIGRGGLLLGLLVCLALLDLGRRLQVADLHSGGAGTEDGGGRSRLGRYSIIGRGRERAPHGELDSALKSKHFEISLGDSLGIFQPALYTNTDCLSL